MSAPRSAPPPSKRGRRRQVVVRGDLRVPDTLLPWERDLLLPTVLKVLAELLPALDKGSDK